MRPTDHLVLESGGRTFSQHQKEKGYVKIPGGQGIMAFLKQLGRRKVLSQVNQETSELNKVLSTLDLVALGVGCTLGVGVYLLPGLVAKDIAGPGVVLSFFFAAVISALAGLCFAEFGARVPKAGSAYIYSYVTIGEFVAFTIGWNLIIEYIIGTASVARGLSEYMDKMLGNHMAEFFKQIYCLEGSSFLSPYFDLFAFGISVIVTIGLAFGVKESMAINNLLTFVNVSVVIFVIVIGAFQIDTSNWNLKSAGLPETAGTGGFLPFGMMGVIKGAATCFYGYVGFDVIATSGEEVKNPRRSIPLGIIFSLLIVFIAYFGLSAVLTLMWPYYLQDTEAPIPFAFTSLGMSWAAWIVAVGGVFGLLASLFSGMFPLPRVIYAMAQDGLLFSWLGKVHSKYKTPFVGTLVAGVLTGLMGAVFELKHLVDLMSIGTLLAYTIVAGCILLLRYREPEQTVEDNFSESFSEGTCLISRKTKVTRPDIFLQYFNHHGLQRPTGITSAIVVLNTTVFSVLSIVLSYILVYHESDLIDSQIGPLVCCCVVVFIMAITLVSTCLQPSDTATLHFKAPFVPLLPALSILLNVYLMMLMDVDTWLRYLVWMAIGYAIYLSYGVTHSEERKKALGYNTIEGEDHSE
ncbi:cationic amino acid transporter 3-like [Cimex lectularius]|uniref:Cationic amino acid transporter C-terminal domain-containing protein n=1 Tax=Cimex lectularius TaxID=79782 RepID=A0A8I6RAZ4_CIMLE|nr:cationic amino acid transporter 3-like [Cimex lectularius]